MWLEYLEDTPDTCFVTYSWPFLVGDNSLCFPKRCVGLTRRLC